MKRYPRLYIKNEKPTSFILHNMNTLSKETVRQTDFFDAIYNTLSGCDTKVLIHNIPQLNGTPLIRCQISSNDI